MTRGRVAPSPLALAGASKGVRDGTKRRRQRPTDAAQPKEPESGKTQTPTAKPLVLVNEPTTKEISLGPTVVGNTHDKQAADGAQRCDPSNATLGKNTGVQG